MEKIKSLLSPAKSTDNEIQTGSGGSSGPVHSGTGTTGGLTGEGSHLANVPHSTGGTTGAEHIPRTFENPTKTGIPEQQHLGRDERVGAGTSGKAHDEPGPGPGFGRTEHAGGIHERGPSTGFEQSKDDRYRHETGPATGFEQKKDAHYSHEDGPGTGFSHTQHTGQGAGLTGASTTTADQPSHNSKVLNKLDPRVDATGTNTSGTTQTSNTSSTHHHGRDAAAVGTAGAATEGIHHHRENERDNLGSSTTGHAGTTHIGQTGQPGQTGLTGQTGSTVTGPHQTDTANRLDPAVNTSSSGTEHGHHSQKHSTGTDTSDKHHVGRDAAVGAGAVGLAGHEHQKHKENVSGVNQSTTGHQAYPAGQTLSGENPHTITKGHTSLRDAAVEQHGSGVDKSGNTQSSSGHHLGRDAAVGAGGAGLAEHEHRKHEGTASALPGPAPNTAGPHKKDWLNKLDPRVDATGQSAKTGTTHQDSHTGRDAALVGGVGATGAAHEHHKHDAAGHSAKTDTTHQDSHTGRDAALVGGVGATGAAHEHHKHDKNLTAAEKVQKHEHQQEHKHDLKEEKGHKGGVLSFLHRDKNKKYTPEEEAEFDRQEREHNSHKARDTAGVGAVGAGAYEAEKHHNKHNVTDTTHAGTTTHNTSNPTGTGSHEHGQTHQGATPLHAKPVGADLGDKLHGVERNRGAGANVEHSHGTTTGQHTGTGAEYGQKSGLAGHHSATGTEHGQQSGLTGNTSHQQSGLTGHQSGTGTEFGQQSGLTGNTSHQTSGISSDTHNVGTSGDGGRNRLHKDAPASHHATTGGLDRSNVAGQGEQRLESDTGTGHSQGGVNTSTNY